MSELPKVKILVVEDEPDLRELICFFISSEFPVDVLEAENGKMAAEVLAKQNDICAVVSDYTMPQMNGGELFLYSKKLGRSLPFVLLSAIDPKTKIEFSQELPDFYVAKPSFDEPLKLAIEKILKDFHNLKTGKPDYARLGTRHLRNVGHYGHALYAKLSDAKYVKVVNESEPFDQSEYERFDAKGINYLFMKRADAHEYFKKLMAEFLTLAEAHSGSTPEDLQETVILNDRIVAAIQDMAVTFGFTEELQVLTKSSVDLALKTMSANPSLKELLANLDFSTDNYLANHSARLPYLANHLASLMGWQSEATSYKLTLAAMLHDATLNNPMHAACETEADVLSITGGVIPQNVKEEFLHHPLEAAAIAARFTAVPPDVDTIVAQHHERCDGSGFPNHLTHVKIAPLSALFVIAHDMLSEYEKKGESFSMSEFAAAREKEYFAGYFKKILLELALSKV